MTTAAAGFDECEAAPVARRQRVERLNSVATSKEHPARCHLSKRWPLAERRRELPNAASSAQRLVRRVIGAGTLALVVGAGVQWFAEHRLGWSPPVSLPFGGAFGLGVYLAFLPWRRIARMGSDRSVLRDLTGRLKNVDLERRTNPISSVILERDDEFGELSRAVHECLGKAMAHRTEARILHRTMRDQIERRTREATARLERESLSDALTGVGNRRALDDVRRRMAEIRAAREAATGHRVTALLIDIDHFKQVNDLLGHEAGDDVIVFLAQLLRSTIRHSDDVVRMGGDEFLILVHDDTLEGARNLAERLRSLFSQMVWPHPHVQRPSLTIGIAQCALAGDDDPVTEVIRRADEALYDAKRAGRNCIQLGGST